MPTETQITGAFSPLRISGKEYKARTLTEKDHAELNEYVQLELIKLGRKAITPEMSISERTEWTQSILQGAAGVVWSSMTGWRIMSSTEGYFRLGWQMLREGHPDLSFEEFLEKATYSKNGVAESQKKELIQNNIDEIDRAFLRLNKEFVKKDEEDVEEDSSESSKSDS